MFISLIKGDSFESMTKVLSHYDPSFEALEIHGEGNINAVLVYNDHKDFQEKSKKLLSLLNQNQEILLLQEGIFLSSKKYFSHQLAFVFPGQGSQYVGMLKPFQGYNVFREESKRLLDICENLGVPLAQLIDSGDQNLLNQTSHSQPSLAVASWSLMKLLESTGLTPSFVAGHSFGELVALCAANAYNFETLLKLSVERGRLMSEAGTSAPGRMVAVIEKGISDYHKLHQKIDCLNLLVSTVQLANINTHSQLVYTGPEVDILALKEGLTAQKIKCALLSSSAAFHGRLMKPAASEFRAFLDSIKSEFRPPEKEVISSLADALYSSNEDVAKNLSYQLEQQVNWVHVTKSLYEKGARVFLEVGPKSVLTKMIQELLPEQDIHTLATDSGLPFEHTLGYLLAIGFEIKREKKKTFPMAINLGGEYKIIQGFIENQRKLLEKSWEVENEELRDKVHAAIIADTDEVLGRFYSTTGVAPEKESKKEADKNHDEVTLIILQELSAVTGFNINEISLDARFDNDLYLDSITRLELLSRLSERFKTVVADPSALLSANSVTSLVEVIGSNISKDIEEISDEVVWIRKEISNYTGIPEDKINLDSKFTEDLMLDSLFKMELLGGMQARYPDLQADIQSFHKVNSLRDAATFLAGDKKVSLQPKVVEKKFGKFLRESLASYVGLALDRIITTTDFAHDLKMNVFEKEDFIASLLIKHSYLQLAVRELLHANTVGDMIEIEKMFDRRSDGRGADEKIGRYAFQKIMTEGAGLSDCELPDSLLVISLHEEKKSTEIVAHLRKKKKDLKLKFLKSFRPKAVEKALSEMENPGQTHILILANAKKGLGNEIDLVYELGRSLQENGVKYGPLSVKVLVNGQSNIFWKGFIGFCRAFSREIPSSFSVVEMPWNKKAPASIPWLLLWDNREEVNEKCKVYYMEGKSFFKEELQEAAIRQDSYSLTLPKKPHILLVGGARGITAEIAKFLADNNQATISAFGRTSPEERMPFGEIESDDELRSKVKNLIDKEYGDKPEEEKVRIFHLKLQSINNKREIWKTRRSIESRGGKFNYRQVDATNLNELKSAIKEIESTSGKLTGVIHAAGITRDSLIINKASEEFTEVLSTKVKSALNIRTIFKGRNDLSFVCFFSSLSSWSGAPGQTDYSLANEIINMLADEWKQQVSFPVTSLLWSVWSETGLASESLLSQMQMLKLSGITNRAGVRLFKEEMFHNGLRSSKVLFTPVSTLKYSLENFP